MHVLNVRNVHQALPVGLHLLETEGRWTENRNSGTMGRALVFPMAVTTVYQRPLERVIFWAQRDANPFFHLYESLWMLGGRNDLAPLLRYVSTFGQFSDNGDTLHGAYGHRWRHWFGRDQLSLICHQLKANSNDRRAVLQMWDASIDLGLGGKDVPCNLIATFQVNKATTGLDLVVFCRSNDVVWGTYGANAVHFSYLLEYVARQSGYPVGSYSQVSVNYHAYEKTLDGLKRMPRATAASKVYDPYTAGEVKPVPLPSKHLDYKIQKLLEWVDSDYEVTQVLDTSWERMVADVLYSHYLFKGFGVGTAMEHLEKTGSIQTDWGLAAYEWLTRRKVVK